MRIKTGIGGLDERLEGGLPRGSLVLLLSKSETCLRMFTQQVSYNMASSGRKVFYLAILKDPQYIREEMELYDWNTKKFEEAKRWVFVDTYTHRIRSLLLEKEEEKLTPGVLVTLRTLLQSDLDVGCVIAADTLSDLLITQDTKDVVELLEIVATIMRKNNGLAIMPMIMNMHSECSTATISHLADIVIEFIIDEMHFRGKIVFWKMRRARMEPLYLPLSITKRGIYTETFTRVL